MLRKVKLYGKLAEFIGHKEFEVQVVNVSQVVSFLIHNFPQLEAYMNPKYYQVKIGNYSIGDSELAYPIGQEDIHFIPVISGAGRGLGQVLLGAVLIGFALVLGGVSQLLFPTPEPQKFESEEDPKLSFNFSGVQNTSRAGTPVPIVYGEIITGSVVISAAIDTNQVQA